VIAAIAVIGTAAIYSTVRVRNRDARWAAAIAVALLVSPLGWIYYLPFAFGSLAALGSERRWSGLLTAAVIAACVPMSVHFQAIELGRLAAVTLGAAYTWGMLLIVYGSRRADAPPHDRPDGSA
jgi:hypothetical protein